MGNTVYETTKYVAYIQRVTPLLQTELKNTPTFLKDGILQTPLVSTILEIESYKELLPLNRLLPARSCGYDPDRNAGLVFDEFAVAAEGIGK